ncbi:MAG: hypothetical protein ACO2O2_11730, partial [Acidilobaceae archaeon]
RSFFMDDSNPLLRCVSRMLFNVVTSSLRALSSSFKILRFSRIALSSSLVELRCFNVSSTF